MLRTAFEVHGLNCGLTVSLLTNWEHCARNVKLKEKKKEKEKPFEARKGLRLRLSDSEGRTATRPVSACHFSSQCTVGDLRY